MTREEFLSLKVGEEVRIGSKIGIGYAHAFKAGSKATYIGPNERIEDAIWLTQNGLEQSLLYRDAEKITS